MPKELPFESHEGCPVEIVVPSILDLEMAAMMCGHTVHGNILDDKEFWDPDQCYLVPAKEGFLDIKFKVKE